MLAINTRVDSAGMTVRNTIAPPAGLAGAVAATSLDAAPSQPQPDSSSVKVSLSDQALAYLNQDQSSAAAGDDAAPATDQTPFHDLSEGFTGVKSTFSKIGHGADGPLKPATSKGLLDYLMKSDELNAKEDARKKKHQEAAAVAALIAVETPPLPTITAASIGAGR